MDTPNKGLDQEQVLATFNYAAEQRRFVRRERWTITYYALFAYAVLAAAPDLLGTERWLFPVSVGALLLVWAVAFQAYRLLADIQNELDMEYDRLNAAVKQLMSIKLIWEENPHYEDKLPKSTPERRYREWWQWRGYAGWLGFFLMLILGAIVASVIILSHIPWGQRVFACIATGTV